jgi:hypothetical protein
MVTVIRPSRARCVKGTIPRHERAVLTRRGTRRGAARTLGTGCAARPEDSGLVHRREFITLLGGELEMNPIYPGSSAARLMSTPMRPAGVVDFMNRKAST